MKSVPSAVSNRIEKRMASNLGMLFYAESNPEAFGEYLRDPEADSFLLRYLLSAAMSRKDSNLARAYEAALKSGQISRKAKKIAMEMALGGKGG